MVQNEPCQLVQKPERGSRRGFPSGLGSVSVETIQETSEIFLLTDIDGRISQSISNGWPVTINGAGLQLPVLKQVHKEVSN